VTDPTLLVLAALGLAAILLFPSYGLFPRWRRAAGMNHRVRIEDTLKHLYNCELNGDRATPESVAGTTQLTADRTLKLLIEMEERGLLEVGPTGIRLTEDGRSSALHILRAHRLWERHLADETGVEQLEWHDQAERIEHRLTPEQVEALAARLGQPTHDPHGDPIPSDTGELIPHGGIPITAAPLNVPLLVVHIEDEPPAAYAQLVAEGLRPGSEIRLIESTPEKTRFWSDGDEHLLAPIVASNLSVLAQRAPEGVPLDDARRLSDLRQGQRGRVLAISPRCHGLERRRLLDLGVLPGTEVRAEFVSPGSDPVAYRIREALIALRRDQADLILLAPEVLEPEVREPQVLESEVLEPEVPGPDAAARPGIGRTTPAIGGGE